MRLFQAMPETSQRKSSWKDAFRDTPITIYKAYILVCQLCEDWQRIRLRMSLNQYSTAPCV